MSEVQRAIDYFASVEKPRYNRSPMERMAMHGWRMRQIALTALIEKQKRMQGCEYCEAGFECDTKTFKPVYQDSIGPELFINDDNDCVPANFCPNCSRKLEREARHEE